MLDDFREMPQYLCHKVVGALKIKAVDEQPHGILLEFTDPDYLQLFLPTDFVTRHNPQPSDYLVTYKDGYTSISPADTFEAGYTKL